MRKIEAKRNQSGQDNRETGSSTRPEVLLLDKGAIIGQQPEVPILNRKSGQLSLGGGFQALQLIYRKPEVTSDKTGSTRLKPKVVIESNRK